MLLRIRKRVTYANVAMTTALIFAMSGGAYAARKYLITSTKQISPKVLIQLEGKMGKAGANGVQGQPGPGGPQGQAGVNGKDGAPGVPGESVTAKPVPTKVATCAQQGGAEFKVGATTTFACNGQTGFTETLPKGKTLTGEWTILGNAPAANTGFETSASYGIPLAAAPTTHYVRVGATLPAGCTGSVTEPVASPGNLCVFAAREENTLQKLSIFFFPTICDLSTEVCFPGSPTAEGEGDRFGFGIEVLAAAEGRTWANGTWAVTAE
jgi:hypothetical protein